MDVTTIKSLVDAGSLVVCLVIIAIMWKAYNARIDAHIEDLKTLRWHEQIPPRSNTHTPGSPDLTPSLN